MTLEQYRKDNALFIQAEWNKYKDPNKRLALSRYSEGNTLNDFIEGMYKDYLAISGYDPNKPELRKIPKDTIRGESDTF